MDALRFLERNRASLTILRGPAVGHEVELREARILIGRAASARLRLDEGSVSHEHAALELGATGFGIRDLDSTNGVRVNGGSVDVAELAHGDRISIGACELQYVVERRSDDAPSWQLDDLEA